MKITVKRLIKKSTASFLAFVMLLSCFAAFGTVADAAVSNTVTFEVGHGRIKIFPDHYDVDGNCTDADATVTEYVFTGTCNSVDNEINFYNESDTAPTVTYNATFNNLTIKAAKYCSCVYFGDVNHGNKDNIVVNLKLKGNIYVEADNHHALTGAGATVNISCIGDTVATFTNRGNYSALNPNSIYNKVGDYHITVSGDSRNDYNDAFSRNPLIVDNYFHDLPVLEGYCGQKLSDIKFPEVEGNVPGIWSWTDDCELGEPSDTPKTFIATFTPLGSNTFSKVNNVNVRVLVKRVPAPATEYTVPEGLTGYADIALSSVKLPQGWTWDKPNAVLAMGTKSYPATFTPSKHTDIYGPVKMNLNVTCKVSKATLPAPTVLKKLRKGKKSFKATWKKAKYVEGYEIQYSLKKSMKKAKKLNVKGAVKTKATVKKLKAKKTYYVRIRSYKTIGGKKVYSSWSNVKSVKVK